jgi:osmotically-inducible protein OsmY
MPPADDRQLAYQVERELGQLPDVDLRDVRVSVVNGIARVEGVVDSQREIEAIRRAVVGIPGITAIDDAIAVELAGRHEEQDPTTGVAP